MGHNPEGGSIEGMVWDHFSVENVARRTSREILCSIKVVGIISTVYRMHKLLEMLGKGFLISNATLDNRQVSH